jgi:hypothetical protein
LPLMDVVIAPHVRSALRLGWFTPWRCRALLAVLIGINFFASWHYLTHGCPIDLSGDEAQYWDWSRHLDLSYYSKGPLVAYLIRASCSLLGQTMPAVRLPALILAMGTALCTYWLTRRLFGSDPLALGAAAMAAIVPIFSAGSMLMTIDPPFFFFWALATCLAVTAIFDDRNWAWLAAGVVAGLGVLTKYAMLEWPVFVLLFLVIDRPSRVKLKTAGPWIMTAIAIVSLTPILIWNARHDWVSLRHVSGQIGAHGSGGNTIAFLLSQFAAINPFIAGLMIAAVIHAFGSKVDPHRRANRWLICIGLPFFLFCLGDSLISKVQANWPAPAYFTLLILTAHFIAVRWRDVRGWFIGAVVCGIIMQVILHDMTQLYPVVGWIDRTFPHWVNKQGQPAVRAKTVDLEYKLRGIRDPFAKAVAEDLKQLPADSFVMTEAYEDASVLAFYLPGQPKTYFAGSYWTAPFPIRRRWTQFDIWPDRALDRPELRGKDCIYIGTMIYAPLAKSFDSVQRLPDIVIRKRGLEITRFEVWKCIGFKGMHRPPGEGPR